MTFCKFGTSQRVEESSKSALSYGFLVKVKRYRICSIDEVNSSCCRGPCFLISYSSFWLSEAFRTCPKFTVEEFPRHLIFPIWTASFRWRSKTIDFAYITIFLGPSFYDHQPGPSYTAHLHSLHSTLWQPDQPCRLSFKARSLFLLKKFRRREVEVKKKIIIKTCVNVPAFHDKCYRNM